ncbi:hypothetical protein [Allocoleopsis sp.]|uniref:hypothetical protein n=1 Tax=Allocoleopsis sp. TaxID=3088169 RepID=UPI002FD09C07
MTLVGQWQKVTSTKCSEAYPDTVEFSERGIYVGKKGDQGLDFTLWDAGGYEVLEGNQVRIAIASDEEVLYKFSTSGSILTFVDREGCEFKYRRVD